MNDELKLVGSRIQKTRKEKNISQNELADKVEISASHLSAIECGRSNFGVDIFMRITEALNVSADSLLRTNTPVVSAIYASELEALLKDCTPAEAEAMLNTIRQMKAAFQASKTKTTE